MAKKRLRSQRGFTLLEMAFAAAALGIMALAMAPSFSAMRTAQKQAYDNEQADINQRIARALVAHAEDNAYPPGTLTAPCNNSTNKVFASVYNTTYCSGTTSSLRNYLVQEGVPLEKVEHDGSSNQNVRVYQRVAYLSQDAFLFYQGGPLAFLDYDVGVVYTTNCGRGDACNVATATSTAPPQSQPRFADETAATAAAPRLTSAVLSTWKPGTQDVGVAYVSTLPLQKKMMRQTAAHLERIRDAFLRYYESRRLAAPASTANHFPQPSDPAMRLPADPSPETNQGCREGWYALDAANIDVLAQVGLGASVEYGRTAWGAAIEYCRDYDPSLTSGYGVAPHYAAIRVLRYLSEGFPPEDPRAGGDPFNNIVLSF